MLDWKWREWLTPLVGAGILAGLAIGFGGDPTPSTAQNARRVRLGYFPNVTHAPAVAGVARDVLVQALPSDVVLEPKVFNAGPEAMEALLAGEIDVCYVGPSPAINTYLKSEGRALRILAGACSGGAALVARADSSITTVADLAGKRVAVPQLGGTQDISLRHFLNRRGLRAREKGGSVEILPIKNPDILALLQRKQLDAAWVPEPWAARLIHETGARLVIDERDLWPERRFTTTVVVARDGFLQEQPELVTALLRGHARSVEWLQSHPEEGQAVVNAELKRFTGKALPEAVLRDAWRRVEFTTDPIESSVTAFADAAVNAGYLAAADLRIEGLFERAPLARVQVQAR